jgi:hypothetical protein
VAILIQPGSLVPVRLSGTCPAGQFGTKSPVQADLCSYSCSYFQLGCFSYLLFGSGGWGLSLPPRAETLNARG